MLIRKSLEAEAVRVVGNHSRARQMLQRNELATAAVADRRFQRLSRTRPRFHDIIFGDMRFTAVKV